jgi:SAM-dependent methyltransferase
VSERPQGSSVEDFSDQWVHYKQQAGRYASEEMLADYLDPLLDLRSLAGADVCEVGCGNGRFLRHLAARAKSVTGIEPSEAYRNSIEYTRDLPNVRVVHSDVYDVTIENAFDYVFCLGVLHHTPDPAETVRRIRRMTKPSGKAVIWTYGREGNGLYLLLARCLRVFTTRMSHRALERFSSVLLYPLKAYIALCRTLPLPMRGYMRRVLATYDDYTLRLTIYDQLNPSIAGYWSREELAAILRAGGFDDVAYHHRHGYSWTALARKSAT